ncbi:metal ABC transporter solute-binding protein, Zn/Mn family [Alkalibacterium kapii]|uniref:Zinc ABC transporter substrate-binding protein n=1 Tax=Alkalibacterium kapii TaxID=426704 RepID=A0A511B1D6_9LACT|nr:zinc ABC transporter substrate-binding protein [Alkalibacterium kapii]GEK91637.1 zinc ABC transporter substrate-binding protein [Alkalibacterium kapii]
MNRIYKLLISLITLTALGACASNTQDAPVDSESNNGGEAADSTEAGKGKFSVVTTFYPVYEFTEQVAGDLADIEMMISGGTDVHHYEPSARDMAMINDADMFVYSSDEMETWVKSMLDSIDNEDLVVVEQAAEIDLLDSGEAIDDEEGHAHEEENDVHAVDPHVWLDPLLVQEQIERVKEAFIEIDPEHSKDYSRNTEAYQSELQALHETFESAFSGASKRRFVTQHEAFGYLAHRYDLIQMAVGGITTEVEVSPSRIAEINQLVLDYDIPVIYFQEGANSSIAETVANETGADVAELYSLAYLPETIEAKGQGYIEGMRRNLEALKLSIQ